MDYKKIIAEGKNINREKLMKIVKCYDLEQNMRIVNAQYKKLKRVVHSLLDELFNTRPMLCTMHINDAYGCNKLSELKTKQRISHKKYSTREITELCNIIKQLKIKDNQYKKLEKERLNQMKTTNGYYNDVILSDNIISKYNTGKDKLVPKCNKQRSSKELKIALILNKLCTKYKLYYFHGQKFPFCKKHSQLEYDFWCILVLYNRVIQFVIEYDGIYHFENIHDTLKQVHFNDILKQHYLECLNIHLLRIKYNSEPKCFEIEIVTFMERLHKTEKYISKNKIPINNLLIENDKLGKYIRNFRQYCLKKRSLLLTKGYEKCVINKKIIPQSKPEDSKNVKQEIVQVKKKNADGSYTTFNVNRYYQ